MKTLVLLIPLALGGCAIAQQLPSLKYCDKVEYLREGREVTIKAHCFEAIEPALPIALPVKP